MPVGPEFRVNTYTTAHQQYPSIASDSVGNFVVVWESVGQDGDSVGLFAQRYADSGSPVGPEFRVNTYTTAAQVRPSVASESSGNFVIVWFDTGGQDGSSWGVFGQRYSSSGVTLGPEFRVNTFTTQAQYHPSVASDASGNFVVVWQDFTHDGSSVGIFGQRYASSGVALGPEFRVNTYTTSFQVRPTVASDASGNFVVAWVSSGQDGSAGGVFGQRYASSGAPLGPEFRVNTYTTDYQEYPSVASDASGNFVVVWNSRGQDGSNDGIFGQRYVNSGAPLGPEFRVNTFTTNTQAQPFVGSDPSGNFAVVWSSAFQSPDTAFGVFGQRYASSGVPEGPEFRVNTYTTYGQFSAAMASDSSGRFSVVWMSEQDGAGLGVFGQRYSQIVPVGLMRFRVE